MPMEPETYRCKVCRKGFPTGRSLGGHMRCHVPDPARPADRPSATPPAAAYALRANPKKSWRYEPEDREQADDKECAHCAKRFPSWKSLFGHMRCHRAAKQGPQAPEEELPSDSEVSVLAPPTRKRRTRRVAEAAVAPASSSVSENETEDVALTLVMLSRDVRGWWAVGAESSDKHSMLADDKEITGDAGTRLKKPDYDEEADDEFKKPKSYAASSDTDDESEKGFFFSKKRSLDCGYNIKERLDAFYRRLGGAEHPPRSGFDSAERSPMSAPEKRGVYECKTCSKAFDSHQALGGHRASHKRCKVSPGSSAAGGSDSSIETKASFDRATAEEEASIAEARNGLLRRHSLHLCQTCGKAFSSGQALGGHKRMHYVTEATAGNARGCLPTDMIQQQQKVGIPDLLDLNLPQAVDKESGNARGCVELNPWWAGSDIKHEPLVGLISN